MAYIRQNPSFKRRFNESRARQNRRFQFTFPAARYNEKVMNSSRTPPRRTSPVAFILLAWLLGAQGFAAASDGTPVDESFTTRIWQADDGLPENRVVGVVQSSDAYLWVATQGGLTRFDGVRFQRVDVAGAPGTIAGTMRVLIQDRNGRIWLAKEEGGQLFCFDGARLRILKAEHGVPANETQRSMAVDGAGRLWVSYTSGKLICYLPDGKVQAFTTKDGLPGGGGVCWLATARDGTLWFAKGGRVGIFRDNAFHVLENFGVSPVQIAPAHSGGVWVCAGQRVLKFDPGTETVELGRIVRPDLQDRAPLDPTVLMEDRSGAVWVGTLSAGLYRCDTNSVTRVEVANSGILSLAEDREGNLWVGTRGGGLVKVRRRMVSMINTASGLPFEAVQSLCQDAGGDLWAVSDSGTLARRTHNTWIIQKLPEGERPAFVTCVAAETNGAVWVGARGGHLYRWHGSKFVETGLREQLQHRALRSLLVSRSGDLWIGTDSSDVFYRKRGGVLRSFGLPPGRRFVRALAEDAAGNVWAGASDGLLVRVTGDTLVDETAKSPATSIRGLYSARNGDLWLGYAASGVGRMRDGRILRFGTEQGLPNDYVSQILEDDRDSLWFAGNQGIFQVRKQEFEDLAQGVTARITPVVYGRSEGIPGLQASFDFCPASVCASNNHLLFSMLSGIAEVRLENARLNYRPPEVFVERISADDKTLAVYQALMTTTATNGVPAMELRNHPARAEVRFPAGVQQAQFEFTALSFVAPENVRFRYQLEGLDQHWVDAGNRRLASYTHPPPGRYRFTVTACNNDGIWNKTGDSISVVFEPHFWETLSFKLLVIGASFAAVCGVVVLELRRRHRREVERLKYQRALELERTRIARDLHDDLGVGLTEIGLLGDLAGTAAALPDSSRERLHEMTGRARSLAASLDEIVWATNPANDTSASLVDYFFPYAQRLLGSAGVRCRLEVVEPLPSGNLSAEERHEFFHAYKEALNNIIRHAGATEVQIVFSAAGTNLMIRVTDNGRGLEPADRTRPHLGLPGMRERLQQLGGRFEITSAAGSGTTVSFFIPVRPGLPS
jgi:signal transduction histidine kinase/ligand-binding sensor domain-containing protein